MPRNYAALDSLLLQPGSDFCQPSQQLPQRVALDDAAETVMTDLKAISAVLIRASDSVDEANRRMIQRGVRLLLVVDEHRKVAFSRNDVDLSEPGAMANGEDAVALHEQEEGCEILRDMAATPSLAAFQALVAVTHSAPSSPAVAGRDRASTGR